MNKIYLLILTVLCLHTLQAQIFVTEEGAGAIDGSSWENAYSSDSLQVAIDKAQPGDEIWVAGGTYPGALIMKEGVNVYGSFEIGGEMPDYATLAEPTSILDGGDTCRVLTQTAAFSIPTTWCGFVITNGNATNAAHDAGNGGGAYILEGTTLTYCYIAANTASKATGFVEAGGGGIYSWKGNITHCIIQNNIAYTGDSEGKGKGGGILISEGTIRHCTISNNTAYEGIGNTAGKGEGGGIMSYAGSVIANCLIAGNVSYISDTPATAPYGSGGGIYLDEETTVSNCTVTGNKTLLEGNNASGYGGGGLCVSDETNKIYNSIIWGNDDSYEGQKDVFDYFGHASFEIKNCIYIEAAEGDGNNNINSNPELAVDYHLSINSPAINAGDNSLYPSDIHSDKDLAGNIRLVGDYIDVGAYEYQGSITPTPPGAILYVDKNQTANSQDGSRWENALSSIYEAFEMAANYPDVVEEIHIAQGEYLVDNGALVVSSNIKVVGGLKPYFQTKSNDTEATILNANHTNRALIISGGSVEPNEYITPQFTNLVIAKGEAEDSHTVNGNLIASDKGGGVYSIHASPTFTNVVITENHAEKGGGIYVDKGKLVLFNATVNLNTATNGGGLYSLADFNNIFNSIIWGNDSNNESDKSIFILPDAVNCRYSLVEGMLLYDDCLDGREGFNNPMFDKVGEYTYGLLPSSPAINKGENSAYLSHDSLDIAGRPRVFNLANNGVVDMGAYEFQGAAPVRVTFPRYAKPDSIRGYKVDASVYSQIADTVWTVGYEKDFAFQLDFVGNTDSSFFTVTAGIDTLKSVNKVYTIKNVTAEKKISIQTNTYTITFPDSFPAGVKGIKTVSGSDSLSTKHGSTYQFQVMLDSAYLKMAPVIRTKEGVKIDSVKVDSIGVFTYQIANIQRNLNVVIDSLKQAAPDSCTITIPEITGLITDPKAGDYKVAYGDSLVLKFRLHEDYKEFDLFLIINGDSVKNFVDIDTLATYSVKLRSDSIYTYVIKDIKQDLVVQFRGKIDDMVVSKEPDVAANSSKIYSYGGYLYIEAVKACRLSVYSITGRQHINNEIPQGTSSFQLPKGIYIVRTGEEIKKVLVK